MAAAQHNEGYELNLSEYWQIIVRRRWIIIFCALSMGFFSGFLTWAKQPPAIYTSSSAIKIESSVNVADLLLRGGSRQSYSDVKTQLAMIESYAVMERVAQRMNLIPPELSSEEIRANPDYMDEVLSIKDSISVYQDQVSGIITISATSTRPLFARDLAQAVADEFKEFNVQDKNRRIFEAKKFIQQQLIIVRKRLKKAEEQIRDYRNKHNLSFSSADPELMARIISDLEQEYRQATAHLGDLKFAIKPLKQRINNGDWDYQAVTIAGSVSNYFDQLNKRLVDMALKRTELMTNYTDDHPQIKELREQAHDILSSMVDELIKQIELTQRRISDIQKSIEKTKHRFQGVPEQALELQRMQRTVRINEELFDLLEKKYQEVLIKEAEKVQAVSLVRPAMIPVFRINPVNPVQSGLAGMILGLVLGLIVSLILEAMDSSVGTIEEVESFLDTSVVGFVPQLDHDEAIELFSGVKELKTSGHHLERQIRLISHFSPPSTISEAYRSLRTNLLFSQTGGHKVILVTSSTVKEGKSTIAANLAVVLAQQGGRILLIDADMRKPMQHHTFGLKRDPGLSECLLGQYHWQDVVKRFSDVMLGDMGIDQALLTPGLDQLEILTCGIVNANPPDLLAAPMMDTILKEVREEYDMVIIDMPPLLHTTDATILASKVDGVLLVYHIGSVVRGALKRVKTNIEAVGGHVLGIILNGVRGELSPDYATYKMNRYYAYAYGNDEQIRGNIFEQWIAKMKRRSLRLWQAVKTRFDKE
ncbi:GumC family protein [Ghiorsea bivora]|uniref:GumC family protein n=1 Tax=Ghiorsea bivora TaxID=1485545 RepID=UPI00068F8832|nr:polysaccharide biosynthesis tyrosine autokinase [Ghiorsea bivora]